MSAAPTGGWAGRPNGWVGRPPGPRRVARRRWGYGYAPLGDPPWSLNGYASKLIPLLAEAGLHAVPNPLINIVLQGRHDTYPKRRGMTRVKELMAAGVNVSFGHDCVSHPDLSKELRPNR